ncbi:MAG: hypothetical protein PWQ28_426 [Candidatus Woesearchaeota archaeon]|nr:hypothetical protein [Candidatus Woesearchaeota archaeon]
MLIFAIDYSEIIFVFPKREKIETGKHKLRITKLILNKKDLHYTDIQTLSSIYFENEKTWRDIWRKWNKAFSVERVTDAFFGDYKNIFFTLRQELSKQGIPKKESHEFTLQFLNRMMFIYFISKKKWLGQQKFIEWLLVSYKNLGKFNSNEFYEKWLKQVFFKAFNNRANEITNLPEEVVKVIAGSPYLNGGLFRQNHLDDLKIEITDEMFNGIFNFFEKYNFTIKEDMPLDSEVAVDPQMIGYVYETLASVSDKIDIYTETEKKEDKESRRNWGIFYTPRVEVDFMCRRSVVEYLSKQLPDIPKDKFYHLVFDLPEEKEKIEKWFEKEKLWYRLEEVLDNLSAVDPACGSGAFLVGLLNVLAEIYKLIYKHIKIDLSDFELKNKIIQYSLYGVDVMPWAIHAAELRLWLQLIVETDFKRDELRKHPLLPNLNLNLRIGDSLVQEIGGISFNLRKNNLKSHLKKKLDILKQEKRKYFENSPTSKFKTTEEVKAEEIRLFEEIISDRIGSLETDIEVIKNDIKRAKSQRTLTGDYNVDDKKVRENEAKIDSKEKEIEKLKKVKEVLEDPEKKPFVWDIDFAEIFSDKNGFDIVIGNPPYVRQEMISPPNKIKAEVTAEDRKEYKKKLIKSVKNIFKVVEKIDMKSDYYIYFYFHGLGLLNENGTFCFITSNSWLDVGYGKNLQEFLCKYVPIHAIYDNPKRSFAHADINTIIALFGAPQFAEEKMFGDLRALGSDNNWPMLEHTAKFVMFKKPFEEALTSKNLIEIEEIGIQTKGETITELAKNVKTTQDYRIFPMLQEDLLEDGWEYPEGYDKKKGRFKAGGYAGNKWGGKYLRAPDIFYTILEKGGEKICKLSDLAKIRAGIITGDNKRYYKKRTKDFDTEEYSLVFKSPREVNKINLTSKDAKSIIKIKKVPFEIRKAKLLWVDLRGDKHVCHYNADNLPFEHNFYGIDAKEVGKDKLICSILNSSLSYFLIETIGRRGLGGGAIRLVRMDLLKFPVVKTENKKITERFNKISEREIRPIFEELGIDLSKPIRDQEPNPLPDRKELDDIIFDELGLTEEERKEVYWSVCELVKQRLEKARSLRR